MFNPRKIARFWWNILRVLLPICAIVLFLALFAIERATPSPANWLLAAKLAASLVPVTLAIVGAGVLAAAFLKALYGLETYREAFWHLAHCLFGQAGFKPWFRVEEGKIDVPPADAHKFVIRAGGPGNVIVRKDSAVVLEQAGKLRRVVGPGLAHLELFERPYDSVDLRPQRWPITVAAFSKEGIPVTCEADIEFQIQDGGQPKSPETPFPADLGAVFSAVTSKWIREDSPRARDRELDWKGRLAVSTGEGTLRFILARYPLERLIAPIQPGPQHPRQAIRGELEQELRTTAAIVGAKILRVELGEIRVENEVTQQWIEDWQTNWERLALEYSGESGAEQHRQVETARDEVTLMWIEEMAHLLHSLHLKGDEAFVAGAKLQLNLALHNIGPDATSLRYMPGEALRLLKEVANL